jgi:hypothetical protein
MKSLISALLVLAVAGCQKPCSEGGPCISPEGARILIQGVGAMQYRPDPVDYNPALYR